MKATAGLFDISNLKELNEGDNLFKSSRDLSDNHMNGFDRTDSFPILWTANHGTEFLAATAYLF